MNSDRTLRHLAPALFARRWTLPTVIGLGILASLVEGLGIGLSAPLLSALIAGNVPEGSEPWLLARLGDPFRGLDPDQRVPAMALAIFGAILVKSCLSWLHGALFDWMDADVGHYLRRGVFKRLLNMSMSRLERDRSGHLLNVLASDTWRASEALKISVYLVITASTVLVYATLLVLMSWRLTLVVGAATVAISLVMRQIAKRTARFGETITRSNAELADRMTEGIDGMRIIRAFGQEEHEFARFNEASHRVRRALARSGWLEGAVGPIFEILAAGLILIVLVFAAGSATEVSIALVFLLVVYRLQPKLRGIDQARVRLATLSASVAQVAAMLDASEEAPVRLGSAAVDRLRQGIVFDSVSFRYQASDRDALRELSFEIPSGSTIAFAGPSGGGKSTIIKLLLRFHDPDHGRILVDGRPIHELNIGAWRSRMALVSQDVYIFNTSVRENIAYGRLQAGEDEVREAARRAHAHDFIMRLPDGYDTVLGHRGARLSGGEQQRISLARAIIRDPDILILDEATNALDSISEQIIQETMDELHRGRTVIIIAHRLSTIERADRVVVLEEGRIREEGRLSDLVRADGLLSHMYRLQHRTAAKL